MSTGTSNTGVNAVVAQFDTFTCFPKLPLELQRKIWKEGCFGPRVVDLRCIALRDQTGRLYLTDNGTMPFQYHSNATIPPSILHDCHEARCEALRYHCLDFATEFEVRLRSGNTKIVKSPAHIHVNWHCDIICPLPLIIPGFVYDRMTYGPIIPYFAKHHPNVHRVALLYDVERAISDDIDVLRAQSTTLRKKSFFVHSTITIGTFMGWIWKA